MIPIRYQKINLIEYRRTRKEWKINQPLQLQRKENDKGQIARYTFFLTRLCRDIEKKIESLLSNSQLKVNVQKETE